VRRDSGCAFSDRAGVNGAHLQERTRQRAPDALMALVHLAVEQPGRDYALSLIALHCDNRIAGGEKSGEAGAVGAVQGWMILTAALELSRNQVTHFYNLQSVLVPQHVRHAVTIQITAGPGTDLRWFIHFLWTVPGLNAALALISLDTHMLFEVY